MKAEYSWRPGETPAPTDEAIDEALRRADEAWTVPAVSYAMLPALMTRPDVDLTFIERRLRAIGSRVFLVAKPLSHAPEEVEGRPVTITRPWVGGDALGEHWLWICLNGPDEAAEELRALGVTFEENERRLATAGIATVVEDEAASQQARRRMH